MTFEDCQFLWEQHPFTKTKKYRRSLVRLNYKEGELLYKYGAHAQESIVELGRWYGGSTFLLSASSSTPVYSVDVMSLAKRKEWILKHQRDKTWRGHIYPYYGDVNNINMQDKLSAFGDRLSLIDKKTTDVNIGIDIPNKYDFLFIDGDHSWNGITTDLNYYWDSATKYIAIHDYHELKHGEHVFKAVNVLLKNNNAKIVEQEDTLVILQKELSKCLEKLQ
jgi:hypothetical protein